MTRDAARRLGRARCPTTPGQSATWPFATSAAGLYVDPRDALRRRPEPRTCSPTSRSGHRPRPGTATVPAGREERGAVRGRRAAERRRTRRRSTWPAGAFSDEVVVEIAPKLASAFPSLPKDAIVVHVTAFLRSTHAPVTQLGGVIDIRFANASPGAHPLTSEDGNDVARHPAAADAEPARRPAGRLVPRLRRHDPRARDAT